MSPLLSLVEIGPADTEVECFLSSSPPFWSCWHIDRSAFKPGQRQRRPCPFDSPCTPVPMATWGRACSCLQAACSFSISAWGVVSLHLSIHPSILPAKLSLSASFQKREPVGALREKEKKKNAVTICLFWLLAATLSRLEEQMHFGVRWILHKVTLLTVHHFSSFGRRFPSTSLQFSPCSKHFSFFCWSSTKRFVIILVSWRSCSRNELGVGIQHWFLSVKAELTVWLHSSRACAQINEMMDRKSSTSITVPQPHAKNNIELMGRDGTTLVSVIGGRN